jgi:hypothetical protein
MAITNNLGQTKVGVRSFVFTPEEPGTPMTIDQDSTNFIIYSGLSDSVQISAIETLVSDLKTYGLWTKMRAIYPFVGGSAASHKLNLKDPRNLDAAYRLNFYGGWTHTNNGAQPNGTTGYADSKYNPNINGQLNSAHISYYSRTNTSASNAIDMGALSAAPGNYHHMHIRHTGDLMFGLINTSSAVSVSNNISQGLFISSRINSTNISLYRNNSNIGNVSLNSTTQPNNNIYIGAGNITNSPQQYSSKESSFVSIGDGLTDTEAANFYTAVQKFQTTLGRNIGVPIVSDGDAQAFLNAASITNSTQATAINTLVTDLKTAGIWSKMKALYPFVGGTSTTHKWNLKDPRDLNDAFRLTFSGGWTHGSTGALPNGTTGYAETYFNPSTNLTLYNTHISFYSRTNNTLALWKTDFAVEKEISTGNMSTITLYAGTPTWAGAWITSTDSARTYAYIGNSTGLFLGNRTSVNNIQISRNGLVGGISTVNANTISGGTQYPTDSPIIGGKKYISPTNVVSYRDFSNREVAFASLGDGLTNYESYNFYKAVEKFQTSLGRQMGSNIPTASDIDVQMFLNATQITDTTQINAISTLVSQLKSNNLWNKMRVIYPFVGGTSNTHKFNLKDPRDINEAYRLTFSGGVTHDSNGIKGSTNGYANTYFSPLTLNQNSIHFSWYSNMNSLGVKADIGTLGGGRLLGYSINGAGTNWAVRINNTSNVFSSTQTTDTIGFYQVSRTSSTSIIMQKNNTQDTVSSTSTTSQSNNIILLSGSGSTEFSDRQLQLVTIGEGLTTTEMNTLKTINDNYKTNLGR